ncbi:MAG: S53 family peptidase [Candidatus Acidiferrales bacterium]|jgi:subtilase family serine protease
MKDRKADAFSQPLVKLWAARFGFVALAALTMVLLLAGGAGAQSASGAVTSQVIAGNTPGFIATGKNIGPEEASTTISVTLWLQPHNRAALDTLAEQLYDKSSTNYHQWLKPAQLISQFAPTAADLGLAKQFLTEHNLKVTNVGPANFSVTAQGTVAEVQKAFSVQIDKFTVGSETHRGNVNNPTIVGPAAAVVAAVYGLDDYTATHPVAQVTNAFKSSTPAATAAKLSGVTSDGIFYSGQCFPGTATEVFTTGGALPFGTYTGNTYGQPANGGGLGSLPPCGYDPAEVQTAYNLNGLYTEGFHGEGQTIVIIDWYGSPYITADANVFSSLNNLPPLTSSNFNIIYYPYNCNCGGIDPEINLDVEWSHALAPQANIILLVPPSASFADINNATVYAITYGLGNVISGSYGAPESLVPPVILEQSSLISELAAVSGISTNYATGDEGDDTVYGIPPTVSTPADSPYSTGVGGVSLATNSDNTMAWQSGWGTNATGIVAPPFAGGYVADPPLNFGFQFGSGGGASGFFLKPSFQKKVSGKWRELPDISWLADPYTGAEIVLFDGSGEAVAVYGGTSLATPMFSAIWAIANQEAGVPLGQAAPYLYSMPAGTITDVVPVGSKTNPTGIIQDSSGFHHYTAAALAAPLDGTTTFYSGIYNSPFDDEWDIITFGTDLSLRTKIGWDNVTGLGTPNGQAFADFFAAASAVKK